MSLVVPMDQALTDEHRRYLRSRGAYGDALEARLDAAYPPDPEALAEFELAERRANTAASPSLDEQSALVDENARLRAELAALKAGDPSPPPPDVPDYTGWSKAKLEDEIDRVNGEDPSAGLEKGKVADMVAALKAYFE